MLPPVSLPLQPVGHQLSLPEGWPVPVPGQEVSGSPSSRHPSPMETSWANIVKSNVVAVLRRGCHRRTLCCCLYSCRCCCTSLCAQNHPAHFSMERTNNREENKDRVRMTFWSIFLFGLYSLYEQRRLLFRKLKPCTMLTALSR